MMALRGVTASVVLMMVFFVAQAHPGGRKVLQTRRSNSGGAATAAMSRTEAEILKAVAISEQPGTPAVQATNPRPRNANPKITSDGTIAAGKQEAQQGAAQAKIEREVSAGKVTRPVNNPALKGSDVPDQVYKMPSGLKTANTGRATSMQTQTAAGINNAIQRVEAVAAVNAQPGPNIPSGTRPGL